MYVFSLFIFLSFLDYSDGIHSKMDFHFPTLKQLILLDFIFAIKQTKSISYLKELFFFFYY